MLSGRSSRFAAIAGALLLAIGAAALWLTADRGRADAAEVALPPPVEAAEPDVGATDLRPPAPAKKKSKEEQRFARADRDDDGRITQAEYLHQRRRNFDKLDLNRDGVLQFNEYAAAGIEKFRKADSNADGVLLAAEFATTAPKPRNRQTASAEACRCSSAALAPAQEADTQD